MWKKQKRKEKMRIFQNNFLKCKKYKYLARNEATFHWLIYRKYKFSLKYNFLPNVNLRNLEIKKLEDFLFLFHGM